MGINSDLYHNKYRVKSARFQNWNYADPGYYFVTICTKDRINYFGQIIHNHMSLSAVGKIIWKYWLEIPMHFSNVSLDEYIVMPNHIHGIIVIKCRDAINRVSTGFTFGGITGNNNPMKLTSLSKIVRWYKGRCSYEINRHLPQSYFYWQSRFFDRIIKNQKAYFATKMYIQDNLQNWEKDENHP